MYWVQLETEQAVEEDSNSSLSWLLEEYWDDARKYIYDYDTEWEKYKNIPKTIIVHHTAWEVCNPKSISNYHKTNKKNWTNWQNTSSFVSTYWSWTEDFRYHYLVQKNWEVEQFRNENEVGRGTRTHNIDTIHIAFCWNIDESEPTQEQYKWWGKLIWEIRSRYWDIPLYWHWQLEPNWCPWDLFDYKRLSFFTPVLEFEEHKEMIIKTTSPWKVEVKKQSIPTAWLLGEFDITRYYSCDINQTKYLTREVNTLKKKLWREPTLSELYTECNRRQFNWDADNTQPKHWARYTNADAGIAVACPKEIPARTKLRIEWYDKEVVCRDVGSAIVSGRLDLFVWIGDYWVDNFNNFPTGKRKVFYSK